MTPSYRAEVGLGFRETKAGFAVVGWLGAEPLRQRPAYCSCILQGGVQVLVGSAHRGPVSRISALPYQLTCLIR